MKEGTDDVLTNIITPPPNLGIKRDGPLGTPKFTSTSSISQIVFRETLILWDINREMFLVNRHCGQISMVSYCTHSPLGDLQSILLS